MSVEYDAELFFLAVVTLVDGLKQGQRPLKASVRAIIVAVIQDQDILAKGFDDFLGRNRRGLISVGILCHHLVVFEPVQESLALPK